MTSQWRTVYAFLFFASLVFVRAQSVLPEALERTRFGVGLMPLPCLMLRMLGELSPVVPILLILLFIASWKFTALNSAPAIAVISTALLVMLGGYTMLCMFAMLMHS